jgi:hypothetical protein
VEETSRVSVQEEVRQVVNRLEIDADMHGLDLLMHHDPEFAQLKSAPLSARRAHLFLHIFPQLLASQMFDINYAPIADQLRQRHPPPVYRSIIYSRALADTFVVDDILSRADAIDQHDKAWWEASRCATLLGFPEGRWLGDMKEIDFELVREKQEEYLNFERMLNELNTGNPSP